MQVRDFCLDLQDNSGNVISERKYLDDQLQMKPGMCIYSFASFFLFFVRYTNMHQGNHQKLSSIIT